MEDFSKIKFPIVKNIFPKLLADDITSQRAMTLEEAANGRKIEQYNNGYNNFDYIDEIKEFIIKKVNEDKSLKIDWVKYTTYYSLPFNLDKNVYYVDRIGTLSINCYKPKEHILDDMIFGIEVCKLDPRIWKADDIKKMITELKNK